MLKPVEVCSINTTQHFNFVKQNAIKFVGYFIICLCAKGFFFEKDETAAQKCSFIYLGIKVSKKFGNAVVRNKFKRRIRAIARLNPDVYNELISLGLNVTVIAKSGAKNCNFDSLVLEYKKAWHFAIKSMQSK